MAIALFRKDTIAPVTFFRVFLVVRYTRAVPGTSTAMMSFDWPIVVIEQLQHFDACPERGADFFDENPGHTRFTTNIIRRAT